MPTTGSWMAGEWQRDRLLLASGLLLVVVAAWAYLLSGAGTMQEMGGMLMPMSSATWGLSHTVVMALMWIVMMVAMMLPSAAPMILLFATIGRTRRSRGQDAVAGGFFALGYVAAWTGFSVAAVLLQFALERMALLSPMMETTSRALAGAILVAAGAYQWSGLKQSCLRHCRSPLEYILTRWREGRAGAIRMGLEHGAYCVGCCWMLMLLLFVGGLMNLAWIAALSAFVLVEKLAPAGHWVGRIAGVAVVLWGAAILWGVAGAP